MTNVLNRNTVLHGNCIDVMREMPAQSVDFILTDRRTRMHPPRQRLGFS